MKHCKTNGQQVTRKMPLFACIAALGVVFTFTLPQAAYAQDVTPPVVPDVLQVPSGNVAFLLGRGVGTQNYVCQPADSLGRVAWTLFTPQATLFSDDRDQLTTHFFSPNLNPIAGEASVVRVTWQDSRDTSIVWAKAIAVVPDPTGAGAVAWLKLQMVGNQAGPAGGTTLSKTTFVQRVHTVGGSAPTTGCDRLTNVGSQAFIPYTADYFFYKKEQ